MNDWEECLHSGWPGWFTTFGDRNCWVWKIDNPTSTKDDWWGWEVVSVKTGKVMLSGNKYPTTREEIMDRTIAYVAFAAIVRSITDDKQLRAKVVRDSRDRF